MLNFGGMLVLIGGFTMSLCILGGIAEHMEKYKALQRKVAKLEKQIRVHIYE